MKYLGCSETDKDGEFKKGAMLYNVIRNIISLQFVVLRHLGDDHVYAMIEMRRSCFARIEMDEGKSRSRDFKQLAVKEILRSRACNVLWKPWHICAQGTLRGKKMAARIGSTVLSS